MTWSNDKTLGHRPPVGGRWLDGAGAALLCAAALVASGCGGGDSAAAEIAAGEALYQKTCASCHGADANGMPNLGKGLHGNEFVRQRSDRELVEFLKTGRPSWDPLNTTGVDMPPRGGNPALTDEDLAKIVTFVKALASEPGG